MSLVRLFPCVVSLLVSGSMIGCTTSAYVNIPAEPGDTLATHDPNSDAVRDVVPVAIAAAVAEAGVDGPITIALPEGTLPIVYADVMHRLEERGVAAMPVGDESDGPLFEVHSVHLRGDSAEVGVVRPWLGSRQLVSVYLDQKGIGGPWRAERTRAWLGPIEITPVEPSDSDEVTGG